MIYIIYLTINNIMNYQVSIHIKKKIETFDSLKSTHNLIKFNYFTLIICFSFNKINFLKTKIILNQCF